MKLRRFINIIFGYYPFLTIFFLWSIIVIANYVPGTWLSGWDNLHPELNLGVNLSRGIFAVWQEYQGLGLLGGMAHASDLIRLGLISLLSMLIPVEDVRYAFHFLMLLCGPVGMLFLLKNFVFARFGEDLAKKASLVGAVFYLFNLATLQIFYLPFEPFSVHFALLPWLFLVDIKFLLNGKAKSLLVLTIVNLLATPQAYVQTIFLVYLLGVTGASVFMFFSRMTSVKKIVMLYVVIVFTNAFWLLPNIFFTLTNVQTVVDAKMNQMSTNTVFLKNQKYGNFFDLALFKGFWFDATEFNVNSDSVKVFQPWIENLKNPLINGVGFIIFIACLGGLGISFKNRLKSSWVFLPALIFAIFALISNLPGISFLQAFFYKLPLISQIFRTPFTKLSILLVLCWSVFYATGFIFLYKNIKGKIGLVVLTLYIAGPILLMAPVFGGRLFYQKEQAHIPQDYLQTIDFFKSESPATRIANFPQQSYWGWNLYNWNYSGSGFLWYGIEQPILDRAFDVWSKNNENYYWEISYALYSKNLKVFENVIEKYRINWLVVDENIVNPTSPKALFVDELKEMIDGSGKFSKVAQFGRVSIYAIRLERPTKSFVSVSTKLSGVQPGYKWGNLDQAFSDYGDYMEGSGVYYFNRTVFTGKNQSDIEFNPSTIITGEERTFSVSKRCDEAIEQIEECAVIRLPQLSHRQAYLISVQSKNFDGLPLNFWIENLNSRKSDLEAPLSSGSEDQRSYFVQPPMEPDGLGYALHFDSVNIGNKKSVNYIGKVTISNFDYSLTQQKQGQGEAVSYLSTEDFNVTHSTYPWYEIDLKKTSADRNMILAQSFDTGWVAWDQDLRFLTHIKVNNWANGWDIYPSSKTVSVFYWPQVLEFIGFGLLIAPFLLIYLIRHGRIA